MRKTLVFQRRDRADFDDARCVKQGENEIMATETARPAGHSLCYRQTASWHAARADAILASRWRALKHNPPNRSPRPPEGFVERGICRT